MGKNVTGEFGEDCWSWKRRVEILCFAQDDRETAAVNGSKQRGKAHVCGVLWIAHGWIRVVRMYLGGMFWWDPRIILIFIQSLSDLSCEKYSPSV